MPNRKTKAEKREMLAKKMKVKQNKGATLAGQIWHARVRRNYQGKGK
jgi:hypothetical protein